MTEFDYYGCLNCEGTGWLDERTWCHCPLGQDMKAAAMDTENLYTTKQVADKLGVTSRRVRKLAQTLDLGRWVGSVRLYSDADIDVMRTRNTRPGRPAQSDATA